MPRKIPNRRLFQSLDNFMIAKEGRQMRMASVVEENGRCSRGQQKEPARREKVLVKREEAESVIVNSAMEMENFPSFEPRHQIFRMHGVIIRKGEKMRNSCARKQRLLCDRRQTIRYII